ncbi:hypothetical protein WG66_002502, partial [Moniliophthora roreri]
IEALSGQLQSGQELDFAHLAIVLAHQVRPSFPDISLHLSIKKCTVQSLMQFCYDDATSCGRDDKSSLFPSLYTLAHTV